MKTNPRVHAAAAALLAAPALLLADTLYMTVSDDSSTAGKTSFNVWNVNGGGTAAPSAGNDYVVDANLQMRFPSGGAVNGGFAWPGNSLRIGTVGGQRGVLVFTRTNGAGGPWLNTTYTFSGDGLILAKGLIQPWTRNATNIITGTIAVTAPESDPFVVQLGAQEQHSNSVLRVGGTLLGGEGTALCVYQNVKSAKSAFYFAPTTPDAFRGTIVVGDGNAAHGIVCDAANIKTMAGGFRIMNGSSLAPSVNDKRWTVGRLELQSGASFVPPNSGTKWTVGDLALAGGSTLLTKIAGANTSTITVTDSLATEYPVNLTTPAARESTSSTSASTVWSVLTLPLDKGDLGDNVGDFVLATQKSLFPDSLPAVYLSVSTNGAVASLDLVQRQIVSLTANNGLSKWDKTGFNTAITNAAAWSDGLVPHAGADYVVDVTGWQLCLPPQELLGGDNSYEFPGASLTIGNGTGTTNPARLYSAADKLRIPVLRFMDNTQFWPKPFVDGGVETTIDGEAIVLPGTGKVPTSFYIYGNRVHVVNAPLSGTGRIEVHNNTSSSRPSGTLVLAADNSGFKGRIRLVAGASGSGEVAACTILVRDGKNLGGPMDEFTFDALDLQDGSTLAVTNDVDFSTANRGLYVDDSGVADVASGATLALGNPVSFGAGATLAKTGAGTLAFGAAPLAAGGASALDGSGQAAALSVEKGFVQALAADAFAGLSLSFADGAYLLVDPAATGDVAALGAVDLSASPFGGSLPVAFKLPDLAPGEEHSYDGIPVATVANAAAASSLSLSSKKIAAHSVAFSTRENADGTVTILASITHPGFVMILR